MNLIKKNTITVHAVSIYSAISCLKVVDFHWQIRIEKLNCFSYSSDKLVYFKSEHRTVSGHLKKNGLKLEYVYGYV